MASFDVWALITLFSVEGATFVQAADAIQERPKELNVHSVYDSSALHRPVPETLQVQSEKIHKSLWNIEILIKPGTEKLDFQLTLK